MFAAHLWPWNIDARRPEAARTRSFSKTPFREEFPAFVGPPVCDHRPPAVRVSLKQQKNASLCFIKIALTTQSKSRAFYCLFRLIDLSTVSISGMSIYDMHVTTSTLRDAMDGGDGSGDKAHATDDDRNR